MYRLITALVVALATTHALAEVTVTDAWVRGTVASQKTTGAFMKITSTRDARLVEARSPIAGLVEIHEMKMDGDTMRMRAIDSLALPAGKAVELKPGGYHVMLFELRKPVREGDTVPISVVVEYPDKSRETVEVPASVKALGGGGHHHEHHKH